MVVHLRYRQHSGTLSGGQYQVDLTMYNALNLNNFHVTFHAPSSISFLLSLVWMVLPSS